MLELIDEGCGEHWPCQLTFTGSEASIIARILLNLPMLGKHRTYICEHGHTHQISFSLHMDEQEKRSSLSSEARKYVHFLEGEQGKG